MKRVLLAGFNARFTHSNLALRYLRQSCNHLPLEILLHEYSINQPLLEVLAHINGLKPHFILLSVYIWNSKMVAYLLPELKKLLPSMKIILGGPEVSYNPQDWLSRFPTIDHIVCGPGERAVPALLQDACSEKIVTVPPPAFKDIPFPYIDADFPQLDKHYIYYESSRGCLFRCSYCLSSRSDLPVEFRPLPLVFEELSFLLRQNPRIIKFIDRTFNADSQRARAIWHWIMQQKVRHTVFHFEIHPELITAEDLALLQQVPDGLFQFEIGIQSTNPPTLKAIRRTQHFPRIAETIASIRNMKTIHLHTDLIAGLPYEDFDTFSRSFNQVYQLQASQLQLGFLKMLPGTFMAESAVQYGIKALSSPPYEVLETKWLSPEELDALRDIESMVDMYHNSGAFVYSLEAIVEKSSSPFHAFELLAVASKSENVNNLRRNWQKNAALLMSVIKENWPEDVNFFLDCLRWDWCHQAKSHYYPPLINSESLAKAKHDGVKELLNYKAGSGGVLLGADTIPRATINRAIYFRPTSPLFMARFALDDAIYCCYVQDNSFKAFPLITFAMPHA